MLLSIANSTFKELLSFLRKECRIDLASPTESQKITIKTMLINAHTWMGLASVQALATLLKFIARQFLSRHKHITKTEAVELYSVIAQRMNNKSLDLLSLDPQDDFGQLQEDNCPLPASCPLPEDSQELLRVVG